MNLAASRSCRWNQGPLRAYGLLHAKEQPQVNRVMRRRPDLPLAERRRLQARGMADCMCLVVLLFAAPCLHNTARGAEPSRTSAPVVVIHDVLVDGRSQKPSPETPTQSGALRIG